MKTYRACAYFTEDGQGSTLLTGPEHAALDDQALIEEAVAEAYRGDIIGHDEARVTEGQLRAGLRICSWADLEQRS